MRDQVILEDRKCYHVKFMSRSGTNMLERWFVVKDGVFYWKPGARANYRVVDKKNPQVGSPNRMMSWINKPERRLEIISVDYVD